MHKLFSLLWYGFRALDIPALNTLVYVNTKEIEQSVGRIIRKKGELQPTIIDIIGSLSLNRQGLHRRKFL